MTLKILVVDGSEERRAQIADALCELPGIEVRDTAADVASAILQLGGRAFDLVVAANDLPSPSIVRLLDRAHRTGSELIVFLTRPPVVPGIAEYWRELGARDVVATMEELVAAANDFVGVRQREARRLITIDHLGGASTTRELVSVSDVLRDAVPRWGGLIPPEIELRLEASTYIPPIRCVPRDIELIALHLVLDACEALPLGGVVWLCVERDGARHVRIHVIDSSGRHRAPGAGTVFVRAIVRHYAGELRVVELGSNATSLEVTLPATANLAA